MSVCAATRRPGVQVIFRDAKDAVRWCIAVQMQLLRVSWDPALLSACPADAGTVRAATASGSAASSPAKASPVAMQVLEKASGDEARPLAILLLAPRKGSPSGACVAWCERARVACRARLCFTACAFAWACILAP